MKKKKTKRERQLIDGQWWTKPKRGAPKLLTRNNGWMTESEFWNMFKSMLRAKTMYWRPKNEYLETLSRPYEGTNKRIKKEYRCETCNKWQVRAKMEVDHIIPCGGIHSFEDIGVVAEKMYIEGSEGWRALCKECHRLKTNEKT